ncbi:ATP synthase F1 subunit delta [Echinicola vietnamensis]|uniref:ATP synthase subunit delta n=1 Tax=Echinicola vietnamensis (strain DSM 17526 / LMG 23754 / KMM 6221) TaxID=926556 RepID=L0FUB0_ECHVK|nr:ATP synthase F1 subunit delta [Echinicola vietnamensis]AGA76887.1 ATP synthase, F1 delta subunit [Echinicola vietnamensis DSM 17526]
MSVKRVASRYAKSLMELADERGILKEVQQDMQSLLEVAGSNRDFALMLRSPIVKPDVKAKVIKKIFSGTAQELTLSFYDIISRKHREDIIADIAKAFLELYNQRQGIQVAQVTTTFPMTEDLRKVFADVVKDVSGKPKVELVEKVDQNIIGGFVLKVNDRQLDESMNSKLKALRLQFSDNHYEKQI